MSTKKISALVLLIALISLGCSLPGLAGTIPATLQQRAAGTTLVGSPTNPVATTTPFKPLSPTPTYLPTITSTVGISRSLADKPWGSYPGPEDPSDIEIPIPMGLIPQPSGQVNILLLGSDLRPSDGGFRTDTILLLTLNPTLGTANITSFPRDLYVYIPGWTIQRINTAQQHGNFQLTQTTFEYNFGVRPDHYVLINFQSFREVVDSLGGIDVKVEQSMTDQRDGYGDYTVSAGLHPMDGELALWYARARYASDDFYRNRRQQEVILAIFEKLVSLDAITKAPKMYDIYHQNVTTDMSLSDLTPLIPLATELSDTSHIHRYAITRDVVIPWENSTGAQVLIPNYPAIKAILLQALNSSLSG
jgi:polyisoprenyl-teichoic acid--peptidoglycan teichoic acid transferase